MIKSRGALGTGLRKFEIFLYDKQDYEKTTTENISAKAAPEFKKLLIKDLYADAINDKTIIERIELLIRDTKIYNAQWQESDLLHHIILRLIEHFQ